MSIIISALVLGNMILLCAVHYNYNALCGGSGYMRFVALHVPLILGVKVLHKTLNILNFIKYVLQCVKIHFMSGHKIIMS